jgi:hypothetical protein
VVIGSLCHAGITVTAKQNTAYAHKRTGAGNNQHQQSHHHNPLNAPSGKQKPQVRGRAIGRAWGSVECLAPWRIATVSAKQSTPNAQASATTNPTKPPLQSTQRNSGKTEAGGRAIGRTIGREWGSVACVMEDRNGFCQAEHSYA